MIDKSPVVSMSCALPSASTGFEPQARILFKDMQSAAEFINHGLAESNYPGDSLTAEHLSVIGESPTGEHNQYDAFVSRPDTDTGEVRMFVRRYGSHELSAHAALSEFVVATVQRMADA